MRAAASSTPHRRRTGALAAVPLLVALATGGTTPAAATDGESDTPVDKAVYEPRIEPPDAPNPYLSFLPDETAADQAGWDLYLDAEGEARASEETGRDRGGVIRVREREPVGASTNDTQADAERIRRFGTRRRSRPAAMILGTAPEPSTTTTPIDLAEPDGSFGDATVASLTTGQAVRGSGVIGDEPAPGAAPDFDFVALPGLVAGQTLVVDVDTPEPFGDLDPFVAMWNPDLAEFEIAVNDDDGASFDSLLTFVVPVDGDYYVSIGGFGAFVPQDPNDPASPSVTEELGSEGAYDVTLSLLPPPDVDYYSFDLRPGDIVGAAVDGGGQRVELYHEDEKLLIGSSQDITFIHPPVSPLPGGGNAANSYVVAEAGRYALAVEAYGAYEVDLQVFRPAKERTRRGTQTLFLDFDGARIDPGIFFGEPYGFGFEVELSPLADFLPAFGLGPGDEDAVVDAIVAAVEESLQEDVRARGNNGDRSAGDRRGSFDVEIRNSRDHPDPWGRRYVSRVVVGGTVDELGIETIGIAQSIDVGDFEWEESAVVLLDLLSGAGPFEAPEVDLTAVPLAPGSTITDLVGVAVGNITAHEAGHFFANWHTDQFNADANIQDQGGNLAGSIGLGPDGVFGTADDVDVDFGPDHYVPNEGFAGLQDTLQSISFGLSTGRGRSYR